MLCRKYWYSVLAWCSVRSTDTVYLYDALSTSYRASYKYTVSVLTTEHHTSTLYQYFLQSIIQVHCISTSSRASYKYTVSVLPPEHHTSTLYQYFLQSIIHIHCISTSYRASYKYTVSVLPTEHHTSTLLWCSVGSTDTVYLYDALSEVLIQCTCMMLCRKYWYSVLVGYSRKYW
jgi:hypothetical protein